MLNIWIAFILFNTIHDLHLKEKDEFLFEKVYPLSLRKVTLGTILHSFVAGTTIDEEFWLLRLVSSFAFELVDALLDDEVACLGISLGWSVRTRTARPLCFVYTAIWSLYWANNFEKSKINIFCFINTNRIFNILLDLYLSFVYSFCFFYMIFFYYNFHS